MTSLRSNGSLAKHSLIILLLLLPGALSAQDTLARPADTAAARRDTTGQAGSPAAGTLDTTIQGAQSGMRPDTAAADTLRPDTTRADTLRPDTSRADTLRPDTARTDTAAPAPQPPPPAPVDSALAQACQLSAGAPPDLVAVTFRASATAAEREAVARQVGGTVVGPSTHQAPGAWYLHVPNSSIDPTVADRLIRLAPVVQVGATRCPS